MTTSPDNSLKTKTPFISHYDPSVFYTPVHTASSKPCKPVRNLVKDPIILKVSLKEIGLEGLDSSSPDLASSIRKRNRQKKQGKHKNSLKKEPIVEERERPITPPPPIQPRPLSPRIKKMFGASTRVVPIYEGTFYKNKIDDMDMLSESSDPKPIGLLQSSQKSLKPQPIIPKTSPRGSPRLNTSASGSGIFNTVEEEPSKPETIEEPPKQETTDELTTQEMVDKLLKQETADEPLIQEMADKSLKLLETANEPPKQETANEPPKQETANEPPKQETADEPQTQETADEPPKQETADESLKQETAGEHPIEGAMTGLAEALTQTDPCEKKDETVQTNQPQDVSTQTEITEQTLQINPLGQLLTQTEKLTQNNENSEVKQEGIVDTSEQQTVPPTQD